MNPIKLEFAPPYMLMSRHPVRNLFNRLVIRTFDVGTAKSVSQLVGLAWIC